MRAGAVAPFAIELLSADHDRHAFACGVEPLDRYFRERVSQDVRRRVTACYVATAVASGSVAGFYTLAAGSVLLSDIAPLLAKKLPRYPDVPVARLGRLAVDARFRGLKLGAALLWDAITRAARSEVVVYAMLVDAKDDEAIAFYQHHGFIELGTRARQLILPLSNLRQSENPKKR
jgi:ribosomal protein S18 acetylase RimI-like enzyme